MIRLLLVAAGALAALWAQGAAAQGGPQLFLQPASVTVELGETFEVDLMVSDLTGGDGLGGYTLSIAYDPGIIHGLSITDSGFVNSGEAEAICPSTGIDNDTGNLAHLCFTIPIIPAPGPTAADPEALVRVSFEAVGEGRSALDISETSVTDPQGNTLAATTSNGEVTVGQVESNGAEDSQPIPDEAATTTALPDSGDGSSDSSSLPLIIAIVLGIAGVVAVLLALIYFRTRRQTT